MIIKLTLLYTMSVFNDSSDSLDELIKMINDNSKATKNISSMSNNVATVLIKQLYTEIEFLREDVIFLRNDNGKKSDIIKTLTDNSHNKLKQNTPV